MPTIPLLQRNTELAMPQVLAPVSEPWPEIKADGVFRAMQDVGDAFVRRPVDERPFVEAAGAKGAAMGKALIGAGQVLEALAVRRQEALHDPTILQASRAYGVEHERAIAKRRETPSTAQWVSDSNGTKISALLVDLYAYECITDHASQNTDVCLDAPVEWKRPAQCAPATGGPAFGPVLSGHE
jgi:hypothetical protein